MKHTLIFASLALASLQLSAQAVTKANLAANNISAGQEAQILVEGETFGRTPFCGLSVDWGDGKTQDYKITSGFSFPLNLPHAYTSAGQYTIRLFPKRVTTHSPCGGDAYTFSLNVSGAQAAAPAALAQPAPVAAVPAAPVAPVAAPSGLALTRQRAELGDAQAQLEWGRALQSGNGVARNDADALRMFSQSAQHGNLEAMTEVGLAYYQGRGTAANASQAAAWFKQAADKKHAPAMNNLGFLFLTGNGVTQDYASAARYFEQAANAGEPNAPGNLGDLLATQAKTDAQKIRAYAWLNVAAARSQNAQNKAALAAKRDTLASGMTPAAVTAGQKQALDLDGKLPR